MLIVISFFPTDWMEAHQMIVASLTPGCSCFCFSYLLSAVHFIFVIHCFLSASALLVDCYFSHRLDGDLDRLIIVFTHTG